MKRFFTLLIGLIAIVGTAGAWNYLQGSFNDWNASADYCLDNGPVAVYLEASGSPYTFKIHGNDWYGAKNNSSISETTTITEFTKNGSEDNFSLSVSTTGYYVFSVTWNNDNPTLIVRYPDTTVYFYNSLGWSNVYLHDGWWADNDSEGANNKGVLRGVSMTSDVNNVYSAYIPSGCFTRITFTSDKQVNNGEGQFGAGYDHFYNTSVVWNSVAFNSSTPLYVPTTTVSDPKNSCSYYYGGEWHAYPTYTRIVTSGSFGTICLPFAATVEGATVFEITSKVMSGENLTGINLTSVDGPLTAGKAYIFKATDATLTATYSGSYSDALADQDMVGNLSSNTITVPTDGNMYVLGGNKLHKVVTGGSGVTIGQYRGYIDISKVTTTASARGANFIGFEDEQATNINLSTNDILNSDATMYNLAGQRVSENYKGIVVKNGKKFINK